MHNIEYMPLYIIIYAFYEIAFKPKQCSGLQLASAMCKLYKPVLLRANNVQKATNITDGKMSTKEESFEIFLGRDGSNGMYL